MPQIRQLHFVQTYPVHHGIKCHLCNSDKNQKTTNVTFISVNQTDRGLHDIAPLLVACQAVSFQTGKSSNQILCGSYLVLDTSRKTLFDPPDMSGGKFQIGYWCKTVTLTLESWKFKTQWKLCWAIIEKCKHGKNICNTS